MQKEDKNKKNKKYNNKILFKHQLNIFIQNNPFNHICKNFKKPLKKHLKFLIIPNIHISYPDNAF